MKVNGFGEREGNEKRRNEKRREERRNRRGVRKMTGDTVVVKGRGE